MDHDWGKRGIRTLGIVIEKRDTENKENWESCLGKRGIMFEKGNRGMGTELEYKETGNLD